VLVAPVEGEGEGEEHKRARPKPAVTLLGLWCRVRLTTLPPPLLLLRFLLLPGAQA